MLNRVIVIEAAIVVALLVAAVGSMRQRAAVETVSTAAVADTPQRVLPRARPAAIVIPRRPSAPGAKESIVPSVVPIPVPEPQPRVVLGYPRIVIEKSRKRLTLYDGDRVVRTYPVITGTYRGDKVRRGDRRTPEGDFYVCVRNPVSQYTLSLGLSYPSLSDARRGLAAGIITRTQYDHIAWCIRNGKQPPWKTPLGGSIMLHGQAGTRKGTAGCIAMSDEHIRELYPVIPLGVPVTIKR